MEKKQQQMMMIVGIVSGVVLIIILGMVWYRASNSVRVDLSNATPPQQGGVGAPKGQEPLPPPTPTTPPTTPTTPPSGAAPSATLAYTDALKIYGTTGFRFQFVNCSGTPGKLNVKRNQKFMLDNRDNKAHTFTLQGRKFNIGAYGFAIVSASTAGTFPIACDGSPRAADVVVQK